MRLPAGKAARDARPVVEPGNVVRDPIEEDPVGPPGVHHRLFEVIRQEPVDGGRQIEHLGPDAVGKLEELDAGAGRVLQVPGVFDSGDKSGVDRGRVPGDDVGGRKVDDDDRVLVERADQPLRPEILWMGNDELGVEDEEISVRRLPDPPRAGDIALELDEKLGVPVGGQPRAGSAVGRADPRRGRRREKGKPSGAKADHRGPAPGPSLDDPHSLLTRCAKTLKGPPRSRPG